MAQLKQPLILRQLGLWSLLAALCLAISPAAANVKPTFMRVPIQFIAALGDPNASAGDGAQTWGLWRRDPGPRGVWLKDYAELEQAEGIAPARWRFDNADWWLDENGLLMEKPDFPVPPGRYIVTGDRETITMLTVHPADAGGNRRWELAEDAKLYDVTHLPCRSARYTPASATTACSPGRALQNEFPVSPGATMPAVAGCHKQDYAVLFIIAVEIVTGRLDQAN